MTKTSNRKQAWIVSAALSAAAERMRQGKRQVGSARGVEGQRRHSKQSLLCVEMRTVELPHAHTGAPGRGLIR